MIGCGNGSADPLAFYFLNTLHACMVWCNVLKCMIYNVMKMYHTAVCCKVGLT